MIRLFVLFIGFGLAVAGGVSILAYMNLLTTGYELSAYLLFIVARIELYLFIIGVILIFGSLMFPVKKRK